MRNFLTRSGPGLLVVGAVAMLGYSLLIPPAAPAAQSAAAEIADHNAQCTVCRLPLYSADKKSSRNGVEFVGHDNVIKQAL
jgi:hypothetical protein